MLLFLLIFIHLTFATEELHRTGLLYRDPRLSPELHQVKYIPLAHGKTLLPSVDLSSQMPLVGDQGSQGSCVAWAMAYYHKTHTEWREQGWNVNLPQHQFSPMFVYNQINGGVDSGALFEDAIKLIVDNGAANMSLMPYNQYDYISWPSETAYSWAIPYRGACSYWIDASNDAGLNLIKTQLNNGYTTVLGIYVWGNFDNIGSYNNTYCASQRTGSNRGGHGVTIVGYDDNMSTADGLGAFKLVNSWGTNWGASGYFWMSYVAVKDQYLSQREAYYITDRIGYIPILKVRTQITHNARTRIGIRFGFGPTNSPRGIKNFLNFSEGTHSNRPFPNNKMVFDMTDSISSLGSDSMIFERCIDTRNDGITGTINSYSAEFVGGNSVASTDPPVAIPDYNTPAYARLCIKVNPVIATIPVGTNPYALVWNSTNNKIYCANRNFEGSVSVIDGATNSVITTITGETLPGALAWNSTNNKIYCANLFGFNVTVIDGVDNSVVTTIPVGGFPCFLVWNSINNRVYCANWNAYRGNVTVIDGVDNSVVTTIEAGWNPCALVWNSTNNKVYCANQDSNTVTVIDCATNSVITTIPVGDYPCALVWNSTNNKVYCANEDGNTVTVIDCSNNSVITTITVGTVGTAPFALVWNSQNNKVYCANQGSGNNITVINGATNSVITTVSVGNEPYALCYNPTNNKVYCANSGSNNVTVINGANNSVIRIISVGGGPCALVWNSRQNRVYVANFDSSSISVIQDSILSGVEENYSLLSSDCISLSVFPNPTRSQTAIRYLIHVGCKVSLQLYDISGRLVKTLKNDYQNSGSYSLNWNCEDVQNNKVTSGVYFLTLNATGQHLQKKILILR